MDNQKTDGKNRKELSLRQQLFIVACATVGTLFGMFGPRIGPQIPQLYVLEFAVAVVAIALGGIIRRRMNMRKQSNDRESTSHVPYQLSKSISYRKLRFAWSVLCGVAFVLLIMLWMESTRVAQTFYFLGMQIVGGGGRLLVDVHDVPTYVDNKLYGTYPVYWFSVPYYALLWVAAVLAAIPWMPRRFKLHTLLIITVLVALLLFVLMHTFLQTGHD